MKKVSIYVQNKTLRPSSYYRIIQYTKFLKRTRVNNIIPNIIFHYNVKYRDDKKKKEFFRKLTYSVRRNENVILLHKRSYFKTGICSNFKGSNKIQNATSYDEIINQTNQTK